MKSLKEDGMFWDIIKKSIFFVLCALCAGGVVMI